MKEKANNEYQHELFERLKKSVGLKREEECFGLCIRPDLWWLIEKPDPSINDLQNIIYGACPHIKKAAPQRKAACVRGLLSVVKASAKAKSITKFGCITGLHGFVYPIIQGDKLYGYIGACYKKKDIPSDVLNIFAAFTDTIIREVQKELELSKLYETIRPRAIALSTVHTVHRLISSTLDLNELLPRIARLSLQIMRANRCSIKLVDSSRKLLLPKVTIDLRKKKIRLKKVRVGKWAPGKAVKYGRPVRGANYISVPLIDEDVISVITLYDKVDKKPFTT